MRFRLSSWMGICGSVVRRAALAATMVVLGASALQAQAVCGRPGKDGPGGVLGGVVNSYFPGSASVAVGATSISLGTATGASVSITPGDLLLVIQMQDASFSSTNNANYGTGSGAGTGSGSSNLNSSGRYEFVTATNTVSPAGGALSFRGTGALAGLNYAYRTGAAAGANGQRRFQVVRVPQYSSATLGSTLTALAWNGSTGGVLSIDVAGRMTLAGTVDVSGRGFRGGAGLAFGGGTGASTDYRHLSTAGWGGSKGEGIAGTPRFVYNLAGSANVDLGVEGLSNGSFGRGAPGNAGGGGNDGRPSNNDQNAGGGGGAGAGAGGRGGNTWSSNLAVGGIGGTPIGATIDRLSLGGGGGAGARNNSSGTASFGGTGGGIILIRADSVVGSGTLRADGTAGNTPLNDGGGGGGGGGAVVILARTGSLGGLVVEARGGNGGNADVGGSPHGTGGGGGGGFVGSSLPVGGATVSGGVPGFTVAAGNNYNATGGAGGVANTAVARTAVLGTQTADLCVAALTTLKATTTPTVVLTPTGGSASYTITVSNAVDRDSATNVTLRDLLPGGFTLTSASAPVLGGGAVRAPTVVSGIGTSSAAFGVFAIPGGGSVSQSFVVAIPAGTAAATYQNGANASYRDPRRLAATDSVTVVYDSSASTAEDVTVVGSPDLQMVKTGLAVAVVDAPVAYALRVRNIGNGATTAPFTVTDVVPTGLTVVSATGAGFVCSVAGQTVSCVHAGIVASGDSTAQLTLFANVEPAAAPSVTNTASVAGGGEGAGVLGNNSASAVTAIVFEGDLSITKSAVSSPVQQGGVIAWTVIASNAGTSRAIDALVEDSVAVGVSAQSWSCTASAGSSCGVASGTGLLQVPVTLLADGTATFNVTGIADSAGAITNAATITPPANFLDGNPTNQRATATVTVTAATDLSVAKTDNRTAVEPGETLTYLVTVVNAGPSASAFRVVDLFPARFGGATWSCALTGVGTCAPSGAGDIDEQVTLAVGAQAVFTVVGTVTAGPAATLSNTATVTPGAGTFDPTPGDLAATDLTSIEPQADLVVSKTATGSFTVGGNATYSLTVGNVGSGATAGTITVVDSLPAGLGAALASGTGWSCATSGTAVTCTTTDPIAAGGVAPSITVTAPILATAVPAVENVAVTSGGGEPPARTGNNRTTLVSPVAGVSDLAVTKAAVGTFTVGGAATYLLTPRNDGSAATSGVVTVTDVLPTGLTFVSGASTGWSCSAAGATVTCTSSSAIAAGAAGAPITLTVNVAAAALPSVSNTASISGGAEPAANAGNNSATISTPVNGLVDLVVAKAATGPITVGEVATYSLTVSNSGTAATSASVTVVDSLPAGLTFVSATGSGWSCTASGSAVTCTSADLLAAGASAPVITLSTSVSPSAVPSVTNVATVAGGGEAAAEQGNNRTTLVSPVAGVSDLAITKAAVGTFTVGSSASYLLTPRNDGSAATSGLVTVTDVLPAGLTFVSGAGTGWSCSAAGATVTCTSSAAIATGAAGAPITLTVNVAAAALPSVSNTASVSGGAEPAANAGNNSATISTPVNGLVDLVVAKSATGSFTVGEVATYSLTVSNSGTAATSASVTVVDSLPAGLTFVSATGSGWSCTAAGSAVTCTSADVLAVGASAPVITLTANVAPSAVPSVTNVATVSGGGEAAAEQGNNRTTLVSPVTGVSDLAITKAAVGTFTVGGTASYLLTPRNEGSAATSGVVTVTDVLPAGLTFVSGAGTGWSCTAAGATVTCTSSTAIAAGAAGAPITLTVDVAAAALPSVSNTASVSGGAEPTANAGNNSATISTPVNGLVDLVVAKAATGPITVGEVATYSLTVSNSGTAATASLITVIDSLPAGLVFASVSGAGWTCSTTGGAVTCTSADLLAAGASAPVITLTANVLPGAVPSVTNVATVAGGGEAAAEQGNNRTTLVSPVAGVSDLAITKAAVGTFTVGGAASYLLTPRNDGSAATSGVVTVTDVLPTGLTFVSGAGTGWSCSAAGATVTCTSSAVIAAGAAGAPITLSVNVAAAALPSVSNTAGVSGGAEPAANTGNNSATITTPVNGLVDLTVAKAAAGPFTVGEPATYSLTVSNSGTAATTSSVTVIDSLPAGLTFISATGSGWSCTASGSAVTCSSADLLAVGASASVITLSAAVLPGAVPSVTNVANVAGGGEALAEQGNNRTTLVSPVAGVSDLAVGKAAIGTFTVGSSASYMLTPRNDGSAATAGVVTVTDVLPAGLTFVSGAGTGWSCSAAGATVTCTSSAVIAAGAAGAPITLTVNVAAAALPSVSNTASVSGGAEPAANAGNNSATITTPVNGLVDLTVAKTAAGPFTVGDAATYSLTVSNGGTAATSASVTVVDSLPAGLTFVSATGSGWSCTATGSAVTCTSADLLAAGATASVITLTANVAPSAVPSVTNVATVAGGGEAAAEQGNNRTTLVSPVTGVSDLAITKAAVGTFTVGGTASYLLTPRNDGSAATSGVVTVTDVLPAGLTFVSGAGTGWSCSAAGATVTCTSSSAIAAGTAGAPITLTVNVAAAALPSVSNTASISGGAEPAANAGNNSATISTPVNGLVDLVVAKSAAGPLTVGEVATYALTVSNGGTAATTSSVTVIDSLPAGLAFVSASGTGWTCSAAGNAVTCTSADLLAAGASAPVITLTANVLPGAVPSVTNVATVAGGGEAAAEQGNNRTTLVSPVTGVSDLAITKAAVGTFTVGGTASYLLTPRNDGSAATSGVVTVTDVLPAGLTFVSGAGTGWSCSAAGATVTCTSSSAIAAGTAGAPITLMVAVAAAALPSVSNTASISGGAEPTANAGNNGATISTPVNGLVDLVIAKSATGPLTVGETATYSLTVSNSGTATTTSTITVIDSLPTGLTFVSATGSGWSCTAAGSAVTCTSADLLAAGASAPVITLTTNVAPSAVPNVTNIATVSGGGEAAAEQGNNRTTLVSPVTGVSDLAITKVAVGTFTVGSTASYLLTPRNDGSAATSGIISVSDPLPAGLTVVSGTGTGWTCSASGATVTCTSSAAIAAGAAGAPITLTVTVATAALPTVSNTASISGGAEPAANAGNNSATVTTPVNGLVDLTVAKTAAGPFTVGEAAAFSLAVTNVGSAATTAGVTVVDSLPAGLGFVSATGTGWSCTAAGNIITCSRAELIAAGGTAPAITVVTTVLPGAVPNVSNVATVAGGGEGAAEQNNNRAVVSVPVNGVPDLAVSKSASGAFTVGAPGSYTITPRNTGTAATTGLVTIVDPLPAGLTFVAATGAGWSCAAAGATVTCTSSAAIAAGATGAVITLDVAVAAAALPSVVNTATISGGGEPTANAGDNSGSATTPVNGRIDLVVTKSAVGSFVVGQTATYQLVVRNIGSAPSAGLVTVLDSLPPGLVFGAASGSGWSCAALNGVISCTSAEILAAGATAPTITLQLGVTALAVPIVVNRATIGGGGEAPGEGGNNTSTVSTPVTGLVDLAITKVAATPLVVGQAGRYTITVRNDGSAATSGVVTVTDVLPAGLGFVAGTGAGWSCTATGQTVSCTSSASIAAGAQAAPISLEVSVTAAAIPSVTNTASVGGGNEAVGADANNSSSVTTPITAPVDLAIAKSHTGSFPVGGTGVYRLDVSNVGVSPTSGAITLTDQLPSGLTFVRGDGAGWSCSAAGQVVTCTFPGVLPVGGTTRVDLTVSVGQAAFPQVVNVARISTAGDDAPGGNNEAVDAPTAVVGDFQLAVEKSASKSVVELADVVDYSVSVRAIGTSSVPDVQVRDSLPAGFTYVAGSARRDGAPIADPVGAPGPRLTFEAGTVTPGTATVITYRVRVGNGADRGDGINRALASSGTVVAVSNTAAVRVRVEQGVFTDRGMIIGKVYADCDCADDRTHRVQDARELGVPGVRVVLEDGTSSITDVEGKYTFYNVSARLHVVKVDRTTLPGGAVLVQTGNRNLGDAGSRLVDLKNGELHKADFAIEASRGTLDIVKARRRQGEVFAAIVDTVRAEVREAAPVDTLGVPAVLGRDPVGRQAPDTLSEGTSTVYLPLIQQNGSGTTQAPIDQLPRVPLPALSTVAALAGGQPTVRLDVQLPAGVLPADGQTRIPVRVRAVDAAGTTVPLTGRVTIESSLGRFEGADEDETEPGLQRTFSGAEQELLLVASAKEGRGEVRATLEGRSATVPLVFAPAPRPFLAAGLLQGRLDLAKLLNGTVAGGAGDDRFEQRLTDFATSSDSGRVQAAGRGAVYLKGTLKGSTLLTLAYDSERDNDKRLLRDIQPDEFYPVYGDASVKEFDAQTAGRLYVRLDRARSFFQYGDFITPTPSETRLLSAYDRTLTGARQHLEGARGTLDAFAARGRNSQIVDELPGQGLSGPYALRRADARLNSEKVEIITRDRNQPSVILKSVPQTRFSDYTLEPFTGRILFRTPVPSVDAQLNPVSIRVLYEVESTGEAFWTYGAQGQLRVSERLEVGATAVRDEDPGQTGTLLGGNATVRLADGTFVIGELARTDAVGRGVGTAWRTELRHASRQLSARVFAQRSDLDFSNASSTFQGGRAEAGGRAALTVDRRTRLLVEGVRTEDVLTGGRRDGGLAGVERELFAGVRAEVGYRYGRSTALPADSLSTTPGATPAEVNALRGRLAFDLPGRRATLFAEFEQDVKERDQQRAAIGGELLVAGRARLYARHEFLSSFAGPYGLNPAQKQATTVVGLDATYLKDQSVFTEYRGRDAFSGRENEAAIGLRNRWPLARGVTANTAFERVQPLRGATGLVTAIATAFEITTSPRWKATARAEWRDAPTGESWLATAGYARKLSRDLTFLGRGLYNTVGDDAERARFQGGFALRPVDNDRFNALARYEYRFEALGAGTAETRDRAHIVSAHANVQPSRLLTLSGRYAGKWSTVRAAGLETPQQGHLIAARGLLDIGTRWDAGLIGTLAGDAGFADRRYGVGVEAGRRVVTNLRLALGYNIFGFTDPTTTETRTTRRGFYLDIGFKFDEGLFFGSDRNNAGATSEGTK